MDLDKLTQPPLIEAVFELKWTVGEPGSPILPGVVVDPEYQLFVGMLYEAIRETYPVHTKLPLAEMPAEMVPHRVQHQFRPGEQAWPLLQAGPGIVTANMAPEQQEYHWTDFGPRVADAVKAVWTSHPRSAELHPAAVVLRYIDGIEFDYGKESILAPLACLGVNLGVDTEVCAKVGATGLPRTLDLRVSLVLEQVGSVLEARYVTGVMKGKPALIWETVVLAQDAAVPTTPEEIVKWAETAHETCREWFRASVRGQLEERLCSQ